MSQEINEAQGGGVIIDSPVVVASNNDDAVTIKVDGKWGIQLRTVPLQGQSDWPANGGATQDMHMALSGTLHIKEDESPREQRKKYFKEIRFAWLMVLATFTASVSFQASLNPPGGFWQADDNEGHHAGDPVLRDKHHFRYLTFYYLNVMMLATSLVIMVLVISERFYHSEAKVVALIATTVVDGTCLIGAYVAGTTRDSSWIFIIVIIVVTFLSVVYIAELMIDICAFVIMVFPCLETLTRKRWCPIPKSVNEKARIMMTRLRWGHAERRRNTGPCCSCCAPSSVAA